MHHVEPSSIQYARAGAATQADVAVYGEVARREVVTVPVLALRPGDTPRLDGEDKAHVAWLAETDAPLPPILVERRSMRVIDGMHRLLAASLKGRETIEVEFFDGSSSDAFLHAVEANITHGLPLTQADRRAAATRIIVSHQHLSDRAIGQLTGLAAKTVASIRRRSSDELPQLNARVGRDGKVRPLDSVAGRLRAAELIAERPWASLREVARAAGVSPATARDVRKRLERGEEPGSARPGAAGRRGTGATGTVVAGTGEPARAGEEHVTGGSSAAIVQRLVRDPSLRDNQKGRGLLRLLQFNVVVVRDWSAMVDAVPPHCAVQVVHLARDYAQMWLDFAQELDKRARVVDPLTSRD